MGNYIEFNRNGCLLQGALSVLKAINGVVPIIHSTAGCGIQEKYIANTSNGHASDNCTIASTNIIEKQIIFGGTSRLREQIKNTVKVLQGDLYVVVSGCATEIVGDDIGAMTKEASEQGYPVINISTPGFKGHSFDAYQKVTKGIIEELSKNNDSLADIDNDLINIFGISPNIDPYWEGNLEELYSLIGEAELKVNRLFGYGSSVKNWEQIKNAGLNVVFTSWGLEIAEYLKGKYRTPYVFFEEVPLGIKGIEELLDKLASVYESKKENIENIKLNKHDKYLYYLSKLAPHYYKYQIQKEVVLVGPSQIVTSLGRFLEDDFGQIVQSVIITDNVPELQKNSIEKRFDQSTEIYYSEDGKKIEEKIREFSPEIILGSQLEKNIARELDIPILYISLPTEEKIILSKSLFGISGILTFIEEYSNIIIAAS
jgi:nitrogenase molybdenum-iron protein beta chain